MKKKLIVVCALIALLSSLPLMLVAEFLVGKTFGLATVNVQRALAEKDLSAASREMQKARMFYDDTFRRSLLLVFGIMMLLVVGMAITVGIVLSRALTAPLKTLMESVAEYGRGNFSHRSEMRGGGELKDLAGAMNTMAGHIQEHERARLRAERIAAWQDIAKKLAHDVKNPLTPIALSIQHLRDQYGREHPEKFAGTLEQSTRSILEEVRTLESMVNGFSEFAKLPPPTKVAVDLIGLLEDVLGLYPHLPQGVTLTRTFGPRPLMGEVDQEQMRRVLHNLLKNALEAMPEGGFLSVEVARQEGWAVVKIQDTGEGIAADHLEKIFHPAFTTKPQGTGLGLAIVEKILWDHGGEITVDSTVGRGTLFVVKLPAVI